MKKVISGFVLVVMLILIVPVNAFAVEGENTVHIAMATNENYIYQTLVSMTSAAENKRNDTKLNFHILLSGDFLETNKKKLMSVQSNYKNCSVDLIDMGDSFRDAQTARKSFTAAYYRLQLPSICSGIDKIIYVDGDTIILQDVSELYNMDISGYYVAGVHEYWSVINNPGYENVIGIKSMNQYINSGVLLMNLKAMREDNMEDKFRQYIEKNHRPENRIGKYHDQDVINYTCYDKILHIPLKYNAMHACIYDYYCVITHKWDISLFNNIKHYYGEKEWEEALESPVIIHYVGSSRPWGTPIKLPASLTWWKYARKTDFLNEMTEKFRNKWNTKYMDEMIGMDL